MDDGLHLVRDGRACVLLDRCVWMEIELCGQRAQGTRAVSDSADLAMATYCSSTKSSIMPACLLVQDEDAENVEFRIWSTKLRQFVTVECRRLGEYIPRS